MKEEPNKVRPYIYLRNKKIYNYYIKGFSPKIIAKKFYMTIWAVNHSIRLMKDADYVKSCDKQLKVIKNIHDEMLRRANLSYEKWKMDISERAWNNREYNWKAIINIDGKNFSREDYIRAYEIQDGRCKICLKKDSSSRFTLSADHDHRSGIFRGLLCTECNLSLGRYENGGFIDMRNRAEIYLKNFQ